MGNFTKHVYMNLCTFTHLYERMFKLATRAHLDGNKRYLTEKVETIAVRVPKGQKAIIMQHAKNQGKSLNSYIVDLIKKDMES